MQQSSKLAERTRLETQVSIVKWQSGVTSRFLTESDKGTAALPTVRDPQKERERERDLDFLPKDTMNSNSNSKAGH